VESLLSLLCGTLTHYTSFNTVSQDKTFEFLANFTDILVFYLASSPSYTLKQLHSPTSLPSPLTPQHESMEEMVESLLSVLLIRQPFLLTVLTHPTQLPFLTTGRTSLTPSFAPPATFSSRYPYIMYLTLTAIPTTTLAKILGGPAGVQWQGIILEGYERAQKTQILSETFRAKVEQWIRGWIEMCGVDSGVAGRVLPSLDLSAPPLAATVRKFVSPAMQ
jgi:hypothetical protein